MGRECASAPDRAFRRRLATAEAPVLVADGEVDLEGIEFIAGGGMYGDAE